MKRIKTNAVMRSICMMIFAWLMTIELVEQLASRLETRLRTPGRVQNKIRLKPT